MPRPWLQAPMYSKPFCAGDSGEGIIPMLHTTHHTAPHIMVCNSIHLLAPPEAPKPLITEKNQTKLLEETPSGLQNTQNYLSASNQFPALFEHNILLQNTQNYLSASNQFPALFEHNILA